MYVKQAGQKIKITSMKRRTKKIKKHLTKAVRMDIILFVTIEVEV